MLIEQPFPYIVIDDLYNEYELSKICLELACLSDKLQGPEESGSAMDENKNYTKQNRGVYLEEIYTENRYSSILSINPKSFSMISDIKTDNWYYNNLRINSSNTLISYYENEDHYKSHFDNTILTVLTWFYQEPKRFSGGDLYFNDYDITIECKHNRCIAFPGHIGHSVNPVELEKEYQHQGLGRWCMSQFGILDQMKPTRSRLTL